MVGRETNPVLDQRRLDSALVRYCVLQETVSELNRIKELEPNKNVVAHEHLIGALRHIILSMESIWAFHKP